MSKTNQSSDNHFFPQWLLSPWAILFSMFCGILLGIASPELALTFSPIGEIYLSLLKMCVIPIMLAAIVVSVSRLLSSKIKKRLLIRIFVVFCCGLLIASTTGVLSGMVGRPGAKLDKESRRTIGNLIRTSGNTGQLNFSPDITIYLDGNTEQDTTQTPDIASAIIPENIFYSLSQGNKIHILVFSIILGVSLSFLAPAPRKRLIDDLETVFQAFELIINWLLYLLPIGLCFLIASQVSLTGIKILSAMVLYIVWTYIGCLAIALINSLILSVFSGKGILKTFVLLKEPLLIACFTRYSYAAMPSAIEIMRRDFNISKNSAELIIPMGITICRFGSVMFFALSAIFLTQMFSIQITASSILIILFGAVMAGFASAGAPGVVSATMIGLILTPLGLPLEIAVVILLAIDPVTDPILTFINVQSNCAACAVIDNTNS